MDERRAEEAKKWDPPFVDLTNCTRGTQWTRTDIDISNPITREWVDWLTFGEVTIRAPERFDPLVTGEVGARLTAGITDFEHDSAWAFRFPITGIVWRGSCDYSRVEVFAIIPTHLGRYEEVRVPTGPYDPAKLDGSCRCDSPHCAGEESGHLVVPQGYYAGPPADPKLSKLVAGRHIRITLGLRPKEKRE